MKPTAQSPLPSGGRAREGGHRANCRKPISIAPPHMPTLSPEGRARDAMTRLARLLSPKPSPSSAAREAEAPCEMDKLGLPARSGPCNQNRPEMAGRKTVASVGDLPAAPDCAYVAMPRGATSIEAVRTLAAMGTGGVISHASGFAEVGAEGAELQPKLLARRRATWRSSAPTAGLSLTICSTSRPVPDISTAGRPVERGVAIVTQSGNMAGINYTIAAARPAAWHGIVTLGNQAHDRMANDCLISPKTTASPPSACTSRAFTDVHRFAKAGGQKARLNRKPVIALKTGRSEQGARTTQQPHQFLVGPRRSLRCTVRALRHCPRHSVP